MSIQEKFHAAVNIINSLPSDGTFQPSEDLMLKLYAYYMQATEGTCKMSKPSVWYYSARTKWNAWNDLGNMQKEVAMEKYVEELTKVIETMSYNENVSNFMSLIGPFYEVVSVDEMEHLSEKKINRSHSEFPYPVKNLNELPAVKIEPSEVDSTEQNSVPISHNFHICSPESPLAQCLKLYKKDLHIGSQTPSVKRQNVLDIFKAKSGLKNHSYISQQDMLILTIINLQSSLENVVTKLDDLQILAKSADLNYEVEREDMKPIEWNLGVRGTAFALFWPLAVHLCTRKF